MELAVSVNGPDKGFVWLFEHNSQRLDVFVFVFK